MSFIVRVKKRKKMVFVRVLCVLMIAVLLWFLNWDLIQETLAEDNSYLFFWGMIACSFCSSPFLSMPRGVPALR